jgi:hypothetical protein
MKGDFIQRLVRDLLVSPYETRVKAGEKVLTINPRLAGLFVLRETQTIIRQLLTDYQTTLSTGAEAALARSEALLNVPEDSFVPLALKELSWTRVELSSKILPDYLEES